MGATIFWQPIKGKSVHPGWRSKFIEALGGLPRELDESNIEFLSGMAAGDNGFREACDDLLAAIYEHGRIRVWAEY